MNLRSRFLPYWPREPSFEETTSLMFSFWLPMTSSDRLLLSFSKIKEGELGACGF